MLTVLEYYRAKFGKEMPKQSVPGLAYIISWNLWQMDGLKYVIPESCGKQPVDNGLFADEFASDTPRFEECQACKTGQGLHNGIPAKIRDWKAFHNSANKKNKEVTDVLFRTLINTHR